MTTTSADQVSNPLHESRESRWPGLFTPPRSAVRARIAEALFRRLVRRVAIRASFPDGTVLGGGGPDAPEMRIHRPADFFHRLGADARLGYGEAYMAGDWSSDDLAGVLTAFAEQLSSLVPPVLRKFRRLAERTQPKSEENTIEGARSNIHRHYDLSNDLFGAFLDESMTYSSALFGPGEDLAAAQRRKVESVLDYAGVGEGSSVLEIGTGWGELSIRAAARGARVTSLTISEEQKALATERIAKAGFADRVDVQLCDYRDATGKYDAVVSVEMIEAVGAEYWPAFFAAVGQRLRPGGRFGLQAITKSHEDMLATATAYSWSHKYIFPGGIIPSVEVIDEGMRENGLTMTGMREFGLDYARTLRLWRERFLGRWTEIASFGFDEVFRRMWEFYLSYFEAGFRARYIKVHQFGFAAG
ncbi:cyclopropane-fatty-acyl-phospholipid synthase family protein [Amycolatopsis samaneae]|uniref:Class I SAM-dependent methyltransferase n=1 Tax=Amycolatopsis samaneae TaxID=664691 RepID=A0ABW5GRT1_9PSEU